MEISDRTPTLLKPWRSGDPLTAEHLDETRDALDRIVSGARPGSQVIPRGRQVLRRFIVAAIEDNYLICNTYDGDTQGTNDVNVAKPYLLRPDAFDGATRNGISYAYTAIDERTATKIADSTTEDQVVIPSYVVGDEIYAMSSPIDGTGVVDLEALPVTWIDLNLDGRAWAKKAES